MGKKVSIFLSAITVFTFLVLSNNVFAHCDTLDGPVIKDAKLALEKGDVSPVLKWVPETSEQEIKDVFAQTLLVRTKGKEARELADRYFFETLVRLHRAGEGLPYTGLKPAGTIEPSIAAADATLQKGSADGLAEKIATAVHNEIMKRFAKTIEMNKHANESAEAGRAFVAAYVQYVHLVENIHKLMEKGGEHSHEPGYEN
ncbi:MAG: DUF6448 family protein [Candidatus Bathyarchaeota archaeon]|nr:DUF6448 family protein [Candidatus Bathyarchaeota archaeon]